MAAQTATTVGKRHVTGDLVFRVYVMGTVATGDTFVVPQSGIEIVCFMPTIATATPTVSAIAEGPGDATATLTIVSQANWTGRIGVWSRRG